MAVLITEFDSVVFNALQFYNLMENASTQLFSFYPKWLSIDISPGHSSLLDWSDQVGLTFHPLEGSRDTHPHQPICATYGRCGNIVAIAFLCMKNSHYSVASLIIILKVNTNSQTDFAYFISTYPTSVLSTLILNALSNETSTTSLGKLYQTPTVFTAWIFFLMYSRSISPHSSSFRTLLDTLFSLALRLVQCWKASVYGVPTMCQVSLSEETVTTDKGYSSALNGFAWVRKLLKEELSQAKHPPPPSPPQKSGSKF